MVLVVYGFPTKVQALQFEWAWQHPEKSLALREAVTELKTTVKRAGIMGAKGKLRLLTALLSSEQWRYFPLSVQFLSSEFAPLLCGLPPLPPHIACTFAPPEDLPVVVDDDFDEGPIRDDADESGASLDAATGEDGIPCPEGAGKPALKTPAAAEAACCVVCEKKADPLQPLVPQEGSCPACEARSSWMDALARGGSTGWAQNRSRGRKRAPLKADPKLKRSSAAAAAKSKADKGGTGATSGQKDSGTGAAAASEAPAEPEAAARGARSGARGARGGRGRGGASRAKTGPAASAPSDTGDAGAAVSAAVPRGADKRPARGRRRAAACAALPESTAGLAAAISSLPSGSSLGKSGVSAFSSLAPSASAASPSGSKRHFSSSPTLASSSDLYAASVEPCFYDTSPPAASAPCSSQEASQEQSLRGPSVAERLPEAADVSDKPELAIAPEEDAWCYVRSSPERLSPLRSPLQRSSTASPLERSPAARCTQAGVGSAAHSEPVCLVSDSDSESPVPRGAGARAATSPVLPSLELASKAQKRARSGRKPHIGPGSKKSPRLVAVADQSGRDQDSHETFPSPPKPRSPESASPGRGSPGAGFNGAAPIGASSGNGAARARFGTAPTGASFGNDSANARFGGAGSGASTGDCPAGARLGGATPVSAWMASKLNLRVSGEGSGCVQGLGEMAGEIETLDSPMCVASPTPLRRRLAFRSAPVQAGRGADASEDEVIVIE